MSMQMRTAIEAAIFLKRVALGILLVCLSTMTVVWAADPLPSWNDTAPKQSIITFMQQVTKEGSAQYVPAAERIAVFDNDGTLWAEQPMYFQLFFALDRVKALAPQHPEWTCAVVTGRRSYLST